MKKNQCYTSASFAYLDRVRILGETLRRHHPDWTFTLCLSDEEPPGYEFDLSNEPIDLVVRIQDLGIPDLERWMFDHDVVELCTAVKGTMLCRLLTEGAEKVIYIDPDIAIFSPLDEVIRLLDTHDVILTPHQLVPETEAIAIIDNEIGSLKAGIYNLGFLAVAGTDEGRRFAEWWRDRLLKFCFDDVPQGLFTDQRWCDHVPVFFPTCAILRDPGYNVASWNLGRRVISTHTDGALRVNGYTLKFFHFTKVTWVGEQMIERYSQGRVEVFELLYWYKSRLEIHKLPPAIQKWWAYGQFRDGHPITRAHRRWFRDDVAMREKIVDPFQLTAAEFDQNKSW